MQQLKILFPVNIVYHKVLSMCSKEERLTFVWVRRSANRTWVTGSRFRISTFCKCRTWQRKKTIARNQYDRLTDWNWILYSQMKVRGHGRLVQTPIALVANEGDLVQQPYSPSCLTVQFLMSSVHRRLVVFLLIPSPVLLDWKQKGFEKLTTQGWAGSSEMPSRSVTAKECLQARWFGGESHCLTADHIDHSLKLKHQLHCMAIDKHSVSSDWLSPT